MKVIIGIPISWASRAAISDVTIGPIMAATCSLYNSSSAVIVLSGSAPVSLIIILFTLLALLNAVFFNAFMEKIVILPKIDTQYGFMIALGFAWQHRSLVIFVPFCIIELKW